VQKVAAQYSILVSGGAKAPDVIPCNNFSHFNYQQNKNTEGQVYLVGSRQKILFEIVHQNRIFCEF
jgi:hypothetical protein